MENTWGLLQTQEKPAGIREVEIPGEDEGSKMNMPS